MPLDPASYWPGCCEASYVRGQTDQKAISEAELSAAVLTERKRKETPDAPTKTRPGELFLRTREWRAVRRKFLETASLVCVHCGSTERPVVDHIIPRQRRPDLALTYSNLQVLCWKCNTHKANTRTNHG